MAGNVQHVIDTTRDTEVAAIFAAYRAVTRQIGLATQLFGEVALLEAFWITPDIANHAGPWTLDHQHAACAIGQVIAGFIHDSGSDTGQWQRAGAGHQRRRTWQRSNHVAAIFGLPESVNNRATLTAHILVVPHPGFWIDGLTHTAQNAQAGQIPVLGMHFLVGFSRLDERANRRGGGIENGAAVALNHLPEAPGIRVGGHAFKHNLRGTGGQRPVRHIGVTGNPANVRRAPEHIGRLHVKSPVHRLLGPQHVAARGVLHPFGLAGRTTGVEDEQRMLCLHRHWWALRALPLQQLCKTHVTACHLAVCRSGALIHKDMLHTFAAAHLQGIIHDGFEGQFLTPAHLEVGRDHGRSAHVHNPLLHRFGREPTEHHRMRGANARTGLHGHHTLNRHGHVNQDTVALFHTLCLETVGKLRYARQQLTVSDLGDLSIIRFKDDGRLVLDRRAHVLVQAIGTGVEFTISKPAIKRRIAFIQHLGERLAPHHVLTRQTRPVALVVVLCFGAQRFIGSHARDAGRLLGGLGRRKYTVFHQHRFNCGTRCTHGFVSLPL